jgi:hypothetical protein
LNLKISTGQLLTGSEGAVFNPKTSSFAFQGGWTGYGRNWWHAYACLNHNDVQILTNYGYNQLGGAALLALGFFGGIIGFAISFVALVYSGWFYLADRGNGSCLNFGSWPPPNIWVSSQ